MLQNRLIQLKLFSEKAVASGFASKPEVKKVLEWAWKNEIAQRYVNESIAPAVRKAVHIDSAMALYSFWDENGSPGAAIDPVKFINHSAQLYSQQLLEKFERYIYEIRRTRQVKFLHPDTWSDGRVQDPEKLLRGADSLRDIGAITQARAMYSILTDYYVFTDEGKKALIELAKIQAEQQGQSRFDAIKNYRRFLILDNDRSKQCEVMFRIGFLYDRDLNRAGMAEVNYRWVLKNAPDCRFAGDAEVMLQHLGEPMPGGEELRDEAKRQGKKTGL
jgi:hypothetical protein